MKHPSKAEWHAYIARRLPPGEHHVYETHLYTCDECLSVYMACIHEQAAELPQLRDDATFAKEVMSRVRKKTSPDSRQTFYKRTLVHYGAAAIVTLLLMMSGMFQGMLSFVADVESLTVAEEKMSLSDQLMERAGSVLDSLDVTTGRGRHE